MIITIIIAVITIAQTNKGILWKHTICSHIRIAAIKLIDPTIDEIPDKMKTENS